MLFLNQATNIIMAYMPLLAIDNSLTVLANANFTMVSLTLLAL